MPETHVSLGCIQSCFISRDARKLDNIFLGIMLIPNSRANSISSFYYGERPIRTNRPKSQALMTHEEDYEIDKAVEILVTGDDEKWTTFLKPWGLWNVTLAHAVAYNGNLQMLKRAIRLGARLDAKDEFQRTPLHYAAFKGHAEVVYWLLNEHWDCKTVLAQVSAKNSIGNMPLHEAIGGLQYHESRTSPHFNLGNLEVMKLLVDAGADVNSHGGIINFYRTPKHGSPLILVGAEIVLNIINRRMWYEKAVDILVSAGAFVNLQERDSYGLTVLHHAAYMGSHKVIIQIVRRFEHQTNGKIDTSLIDTKDFHMKICTPLYWAAHFGHTECVRALVDFGANLTSKNKREQTVLHILFRNCASTVALLTDILNTRVRPKYGDKLITVQSVNLNFGVLGTRNKLQTAMVLDLIEAAPSMKELAILQHPLLETFLQLKWLQLRKFFFIVASIHVFGILLISVPATVLLFMGRELSLLRWPLLFWTIILIFYNMLQFLIMPKYFLTQPESYVSMVVVVAGLVAQYPPVSLPFVSIAFLFAWIELMLVVGRILTWGHYIHMYTIVLWNVSKALSTYVFLIVGFTFSFAILLRGNPGFNNPWVGFLRTVMMMTGEYDSGSLFSTDRNYTLINNVNSEDNKEVFMLIISIVIFLLFVILAGIVLMNLITGLAVAEVQGLVKKGKLLRLLELAKLIAHLEKVQRKSVPHLITTYWRTGQNGNETSPESDSDLEVDLEEEKRRQTFLETKIVIAEKERREETEGVLQTLLGKRIDTITELNLSFDRKLPPGISVKLRENLLDLASKNLKKFQGHSSEYRKDSITGTVSDLQNEIEELEQNNQQFVCNVCNKSQSRRLPTTTRT